MPHYETVVIPMGLVHSNALGFNYWVHISCITPYLKQFVSLICNPNLQFRISCPSLIATFHLAPFVKFPTRILPQYKTSHLSRFLFHASDFKPGSL